MPARGRDQRDRLAGERLVWQPRHPVDGILQSAGDRIVIFRADEDHAIGGTHRIGELLHRGREAGRILHIGVIEREFRERRRFRDLQARRRVALQQVHDHAVVGALAQAAANADDVECLAGHSDPLIPSTSSMNPIKQAQRSLSSSVAVPSVRRGGP